MLRLVIRLAIAALVINAAWRVGTVYWHFYKWEDRLQEIAQFGDRRGEKDLCGQALASAAEIGVPAPAEAVTIRRGSNPPFNCGRGFEAVARARSEPAAKITIEAAYTDQLPVLPGFSYPWEMTANVSAWIRP